VAPRVDGRLTAQATRRGWPEPLPMFST